MSAERRVHHRFPIAQAIEIEFPKETVFEAEGLDLSLDGLRIQTDRIMDLYAKIFIMIQTGDGEEDRFYFDGVISWVRGQGKKHQYGIQITDISPDNLEHLIRFTHKLR